MLPPNKWSIQVFDDGFHSDYKNYVYTFSENEKNFSLPTISVSVTNDKQYIQKITLNFDDHSYQKGMYDMYEQMCFYTLKVFFPELSYNELEKIYSNINNFAFNNILPADQSYYENGENPTILCYKDRVGIYPYYAEG